jgi:pimeloyl-ACP methyl ester carboxylesterase
MPEGTVQRIVTQIDGGPLTADLMLRDGRDNETPVLLIHGWGGSGRYWQPFADRLTERFNLLIPDLPGSGRSQPVHFAHSIFDHVAAIEALLVRLGIKRVNIIGHSMGSGVAILLAGGRPDLVERLVLTSISLFRSEAERAFFQAFSGVVGLVMRFRTPLLAELPFLTDLFAMRFFYRVPGDRALLRDGFRDYLQMDLATAVVSARSSATQKIPEAAARIVAPTLLIVGRQDQVMPCENVPMTVATIPNCRLHWIEQCGHFPMIEQLDRYTALVEEFLARPVRSDEQIESDLVAAGAW